MRFVKMHGIGNDYVFLVDQGKAIQHPDQLARIIADPHRGIGGDGLVLVDQGTDTDFTMRIFNRDGSEAEMCGNAARCIGKLVYEQGLTKKTALTLQTGGGVRQLLLSLSYDQVDQVTVQMGKPSFTPVEMPGMADHRLPHPIQVEVDGEAYSLICLSMGNPHAVLFVPDADAAEVERIGPKIERHPLFPDRINVGFAQVVDRTHIRLRVWERGSGETLACGTGACAAAVAAFALGECARQVSVSLPGGTLSIAWDEATGEVTQTGPAAYIAAGDFMVEMA